MGGSLSSTNVSTVLTTLLSQSCPPSHQIWSSFSIYDFSTNEFSEEDLQNLVKVRNNRPDNFAELIRFIIDMFSKTAVLSETTPKVRPELQIYCSTISLLLSISGLPTKISPWFKSPALYLKSITPSHSLIQTIYKLLDFTNDPEECLLPKFLDDRIIYAKTLLFLQNAQAFTSVGQSDPSPYLLCFETFPATQFLRSLFEMIPYAMLQSRSPTVLTYIKTLMTVAIAPLYTCQSWKNSITVIEQNLIHRAFSTMFVLLGQKINTTVNNRIIDSSEQTVSLLYTILVRFPEFEKFIDINNLAPKYIASLLFLFQYRMETSSVTFFHSIILLIISQLTSNLQSLLALNQSFASNFTTKYRPHHGTYADLIIEIITNHGINNFIDAAPLIPLSVGIIENLSSTTVNLSFFSASRIFSYLTSFFATKLAEKEEFTVPVEKLLISIFQFLRFHTLSNQSVILYTLDKRNIIRALSQSSVENWKTVAQKIDTILEASDAPIRIKNQKERITTLQNAISPILSQFNEEAAQRNSFTMSKDMEVIWYDWFRVLFWQLFPEEAEFYNLNFVSFQMPRKLSVNKELSQVPIDISEANATEEEKDVQEHAEEKETEHVANNEESIFGEETEKDKEFEFLYDSKDDETNALSIIKSFRKDTEPSEHRRNLTYQADAGANIKDFFAEPVKHVNTLEELENPFGSSDEDELAKFLED